MIAELPMVATVAVSAEAPAQGAGAESPGDAGVSGRPLGKVMGPFGTERPDSRRKARAFTQLLFNSAAKPA